MLRGRRRGSSLIELIVALTLAGLVLAAASTSLLRQQRGFRWIGALASAESQTRPLAQTLAAELSLLEPAAGDIVAGQASDSTLQIRATVASALACDSASGAVTLAPDDSTGVAISGSARSPASGDTLWFFTDSLGWQSRRVTSVARVSTGCRVPSAPAGETNRLTLDAPVVAPGATPLRVTRQERYVFYRGGDGGWYLGVSDWSTTTGRFASPQPVAGPFVRSTRDGARTAFRFFDVNGAELAPDGSNERSIARVRVSSLTRVESGTRASAASSAGSGGRGGPPADVIRVDSIDAALAKLGAP